MRLRIIALVCLMACAGFARGQTEVGTTIGSANACALVDTTGVGAVGFAVTGAFSGTLTPQVIVRGQSAANTQVTVVADGTKVSTITSTGTFLKAVAGYSQFQLCFTSYASGSATIYFKTTPVVNADAIGSGSSSGGAVSSVFTRTGAVTATSGDYPWNLAGNPTGSLSLTMGANTSIFNTTTALSQFFAWKNTTAAVVGTSQGSPVQSLCGTAFHGSASVEDCMTFSELPGNGNDAAITQTIGHTGSSTGQVNLVVAGSIQAGNPGGAGGTLVLPEGTAASAIASDEVIYGDSTLHLAKVSNNNGTFGNLFRRPQPLTEQARLSRQDQLSSVALRLARSPCRCLRSTESSPISTACATGTSLQPS